MEGNVKSGSNEIKCLYMTVKVSERKTLMNCIIKIALLV